MIKLFAIIGLVILLTGCATAPVQIPRFPEPPELLMRSAPELTKIQLEPIVDQPVARPNQ